MSESRVPAATFDFRHRIKLQIRFNDVDVFGHVNNAMYFQYYDLGKINYFRSVMGEKFTMDDLTLLIVNLNCSFYEPLHMDEPAEVLTGALKIGEKSVVIEQRVVNPGTGHVKSLCTTILSAFDPRTGHSAPVSEEWRSHLEAFEGRQL